MKRGYILDASTHYILWFMFTILEYDVGAVTTACSMS